MTLEKNGVDHRKGAYFRFGQDEGLPSLLKTVRGRLLILTAAINVLWWALAYETIESRAGEGLYLFHLQYYPSRGVELFLYSAACLFPTIFTVLFAFIFGHLRIRRRWFAGSFIIGACIFLDFWLDYYPQEISASLLGWPVITLLFSFIIYRWGARE